MTVVKTLNKIKKTNLKCGLVCMSNSVAMQLETVFQVDDQQYFLHAKLIVSAPRDFISFHLNS